MKSRKYNKVKLEFDNMFNKNNFEKKPIKGGTPANENKNIDKVSSEKLSKL